MLAFVNFQLLGCRNSTRFIAGLVRIREWSQHEVLKILQAAPPLGPQGTRGAWSAEALFTAPLLCFGLVFLGFGLLLVSRFVRLLLCVSHHLPLSPSRCSTWSC